MLPKALYDAQSLTKKLRAAAKHSFAVEVISEQFISITPEEAPQLALTVTQNVWCRCTYLKVDGVVWVQAKTLIPESSLQHTQVAPLQQLGNGALGDVLFADPTLTRSPFEVEKNTRSSVFTFHGQPILVRETFLPVALIYFAGLEEPVAPTAELFER